MLSNSRLVLLIESNADSREVYAAALRHAGFTVVVADDSASGLDALNETIPQILIVGFDTRTHDECLAFCERLKRDARTRTIPILLKSNAITREDLQRATDISVLGVSIGPRDGAKMAGAVRGVLAVLDRDTSTPQQDPFLHRWP